MRNLFTIQDNTLIVVIQSQGAVFNAYFDVEDLPLLEGKLLHLHSEGYAVYNEGGVKYAHRLVVPYELVDHKNRNRLDNRKSNLRESNKSLNSINCGAKGVHKRSDTGNWQAYITVNGKRKTKTFKTEQEAIDWRREQVEKELG